MSKGSDRILKAWVTRRRKYGVNGHGPRGHVPCACTTWPNPSRWHCECGSWKPSIAARCEMCNDDIAQRLAMVEEARQALRKAPA